jgi:hypothetical protein
MRKQQASDTATNSKHKQQTRAIKEGGARKKEEREKENERESEGKKRASLSLAFSLVQRGTGREWEWRRGRKAGGARGTGSWQHTQGE